MRRISFALTKDQLLDGSKTVTRRKGWRNLKPGDRLLAVSKCMGLKPGESAEVYGPIEVISVRREPLSAVTRSCRFPECPNPRQNCEAELEGFPYMSTRQFVSFFCEHMGGDRDQMVTRIEFRRVEPRALDGVKLSAAMRKTLLRFASHGRLSTFFLPVRTTTALETRGLVVRSGAMMAALTDLGRQVAAELREGGQ